MLFGVRRDLQEQLVTAGWRVRTYVPFGSQWYPYFMRRLAERPANVSFILRNLWRSAAGPERDPGNPRAAGWDPGGSGLGSGHGTGGATSASRR